ncbi:MAG: hypothetical protein A2849_04260 [Candidatus Taylorbacteria bacterium RIFCSPHIGHO2_01_FULL_51_15]|uniref:Methyltransferase domain-containing protein n=1 Tax=Candidatus Taylorbacteria bacterium RIFCSPHIGHO2_01_FULL_51_15 TaxID=1802304 RepID=A0A1G2MCV1_9BACT|nr:MAG: hypothetical protein A2849_04260 [Candidatus Taylorbacteria bacterium RIFCSPHIGHO2_01_FULL_51_15]
MISLSKRIYREVLQYCRSSGLIEKLEQSLAIPERERFNQLNISKHGLGVLDAVHCVYDKARSFIFLEELERLANVHIAIEAGIGTGLLSFLMAARGIVVHGVELNPEVLDLASKIKNHLAKQGVIDESSIHFRLADATTYSPSIAADVLVSENLYTGMFYEKQVDIMNNLLSHARKDAICIPKGLKSYVSLAETVFPREPKHAEMFVPGSEQGFDMKSNVLSETFEYDYIDFTKKAPSGLDRDITLNIIRPGKVNSLLIGTEVLMPSGRVIGRHETVFLNNDIIIAIESIQSVVPKSRMSVRIKYAYGSRPEEGLFEVKRL